VRARIRLKVNEEANEVLSRVAACAATEQGGAQPEMIVTLVHGTFAKNAEWIEDGSILASALRAELPPHTIIRPFRWDGKNSFASRLHAAELLNGHICLTESLYPCAKHILIGHSHGGNVIAYWLKRYPESKEKVSGTAFLATPFISVSVARDWIDSTLSIAVPLVMLCALLFNFTATRLLPFRVLLQVQNLLLPAATFLVVIAAREIFFSLLKRLWHLTHRLAAELSTVDCRPENPFICRLLGDEASAVLQVAQFRVWLIANVRRVIGRVICFLTVASVFGFNKNGSRSHRVVVTVQVLSIVLLGYFWSSNHVPGLREFAMLTLQHPVLLVSLGIAVVPIICGFGTLIFFVPVLGLLMISAVTIGALGRFSAIVALCCEMSVEVAPLGNIPVLLEMGDPFRAHNSAAKIGELRHSEVYSSPNVITALIKWAKAC
jgi:hypothetical protein